MRIDIEDDITEELERHNLIRKKHHHYCFSCPICGAKLERKYDHHGDTKGYVQHSSVAECIRYLADQIDELKGADE